MKKNIIIAVSWLAFGALAVEYTRLVHDFKIVEKIVRDNAEVIEQCKTIIVNETFEDIVENFDQ